LAGLYNAGQAGILAVISSSNRKAPMHSTIQATGWIPYEVKAASLLYERRSEDLQLEQLRIRLQKKMSEAENRSPEPAAA
jgi:hypothetical protein